MYRFIVPQDFVPGKGNSFKILLKIASNNAPSGNLPHPARSPNIFILMLVL